MALAVAVAVPVARPSWLAVGGGLLAAWFGISAVAVSRLPFAPTPGQCARAATGGVAAVFVDYASLAVVAAVQALLVAIVVVTLPPLRRQGPFALVAALLLAPGILLLAVMLWPAAATVWLAGIGAVVVALAALPLLRERGLWSLAIAGVVAALPGVLAWREARCQGHAATPIAALQRQLHQLPPGFDTVGLLLGSSLDADAVRALALVALPRSLFAASADSMAATWLRRLGLPVLQSEHDRCVVLPAAPLLPAGDRVVTPLVQRAADGAITALSIRCERASTGSIAVVFGPAGALEVAFADGGASLTAAQLTTLRGWLGPLPTALRLRILVVPPDPTDDHAVVDLSP